MQIFIKGKYTTTIETVRAFKDFYMAAFKDIENA